MKGTDEAVLNVFLVILSSPIWVPVLVVMAVGALLWWLLRLAFSAGQHMAYGPPARRERRRIYRERDDAIADIVGMRRDAERRMREIAREEADVIEGTATELPD